MGDRANVYVQEAPDRGVWLYTHWLGTDLPGIVATALRDAERDWSDPPYLIRRLFVALLKQGGSSGSSLGISSEMQDNEGNRAVLVLEPYARTIKAVRYDVGRGLREVPGPILNQTTFDVFAQSTASQACAFRDGGTYGI